MAALLWQAASTAAAVVSSVLLAVLLRATMMLRATLRHVVQVVQLLPAWAQGRQMQLQ
jgi:hypothetical protein